MAQMSVEDAIKKLYESVLDLKVVTGTYTGDGSFPRNFNLGFKPKAILIMGGYGEAAEITYRSPSEYCYGGLFFDSNPLGIPSAPVAEITDNGFTLYNNTPYDVTTIPGNRINYSSIVYYYIAFK